MPRRCGQRSPWIESLPPGRHVPVPSVPGAPSKHLSPDRLSLPVLAPAPTAHYAKACICQAWHQCAEPTWRVSGLRQAGRRWAPVSSSVVCLPATVAGVLRAFCGRRRPSACESNGTRTPQSIPSAVAELPTAQPWPGCHPLGPGRTCGDRQRAGARARTREALIFRRIIRRSRRAWFRDTSPA
jgi:hypothetical protein